MTEAYGQLLSLLQSRRSVRRFRPDALPAGTVERLVEAARWAPSAGNRQAWRILSVTNAATRDAMARAAADGVARLRAGLREDLRGAADLYMKNFLHFTSAPLLLVFVYRAGTDALRAGLTADPRPERESLSSVSAAIQNLLLAAHALGLGACWMTGPLVAAPELAALLPLPPGWELAALVPVGVPGEHPAAPPRRDAARLLQRVE